MLIEEVREEGRVLEGETTACAEEEASIKAASTAAGCIDAPDGFDEREFVEAAREQASQTLQTLATGLMGKPAQRARVMQTPGLLVALIRGSAAPVPEAWAPSRSVAHCAGSLAVLGHRHPLETEDEHEDEADKCSVLLGTEEVMGGLEEAIRSLTGEDKDKVRRTCRGWTRLTDQEAVDEGADGEGALDQDLIKLDAVEIEAVMIDREHALMALWHTAATLVECKTTKEAVCSHRGLLRLAGDCIGSHLSDPSGERQRTSLRCANIFEAPDEWPQIPLSYCIPATVDSSLVLYHGAMGLPGGDKGGFFSRLDDSLVASLAIERATAFKESGNLHFRHDDWVTALWQYSIAIAVASQADPSRHVYYSNRSECFLRLGKFDKAMADADAALAIDPDHARSHKRRQLAMDHL